MSDIPVFDMQTIASGPSLVGEANPQAFGLVVIDGPEDAVTNLNKREGSHIEFLSCDQKRHDDGRRGVVQLVCMNNSESSNCNDLHLGGLAGTIMRMPDDCGFASYAVAHSVVPSLNQTLPDHLKKRASLTRLYTISNTAMILDWPSEILATSTYEWITQTRMITTIKSWQQTTKSGRSNRGSGAALRASGRIVRLPPSSREVL